MKRSRRVLRVVRPDGPPHDHDGAEPCVGTAPIRIGFIGIGSSAGLAPQLGELLPPGIALEVLTIPAAAALIAERALTVLIVAADAADLRQTVRDLGTISRAGEAHPLAVFALVPRDHPTALARAFELHVADVAGLPIEPHEVRARLAALLGRRRIAFARAAETRAAWQLATIDPVTGLFNRHHLAATLPAQFAAARRQGQPLTVMMIDVDGLKLLNDRLGHAVGDEVLAKVAGAATAAMRPSDTIARVGGDEIVIVMPDTGAAAARALATYLVQRMTRIGAAPSIAAPVTVSIGLATCDGRDDDSQALLRRADAALYAAKRGGRNRVAEAA